jgi:hypothetical protein
MSHFRSLGYCAKGVRNGFDRYGFSKQEYSDFLATGMSSEELVERTNGDAMVQKVVEVARERG